MDIRLDEEKSVVFVKPTAALKAEDFTQFASIIDGYVSKHGNLKGIIIESLKFPGWENFQAFKAHVKFIKEHHTKVQKIAIVTDSMFAEIGKVILGPFVHPEVKHFPYGQIESAKVWVE